MTCHAKRYNDNMICGTCGLQWDFGDADPPACNPAKSQEPSQLLKQYVPSAKALREVAKLFAPAPTVRKRIQTNLAAIKNLVKDVAGLRVVDVLLARVGSTGVKDLFFHMVEDAIMNSAEGELIDDQGTIVKTSCLLPLYLQGNSLANDAMVIVPIDRIRLSNDVALGMHSNLEPVLQVISGLQESKWCACIVIVCQYFNPDMLKIKINSSKPVFIVTSQQVTWLKTSHR